MAIKPKPSPGSSHRHWLKPAALLLLVGVTLVATVYIMFLQPATWPAGGKMGAGLAKKPGVARPVPVAPPEATAPSPPREPLLSVSAAGAASENPPAAAAGEGEQLPSGKPRVAIIIDDLGQQKKIPEQLLALGLNFTFALLPHTPFARDLARQAQESGHDLLLHLPMEPEDSHWHPGPGTLMLTMSPETIRETIRDALASVPTAIGINNHMGSRFSADRPAMTVFLKSLQESHLLFVDSLTSAKSLGYPLAQELGVRSGRRDLFLDNEQEHGKIVRQLQALIAIAKKNGSAIGIGHPHPATLAALSQMQEQLRTQVTVVGIHSLVK